MSAEMLLYNEIGSSGVGAGDFINDLRNAGGPVHLRVNSPGGDVFDGVAIHNAIVGHPHDVTVTVDGLAASAASFVAMAGTTVQMHRGAQMMIHDAWGGQVGNAAEMRRTADLLDGFSNQIASIYQARAGGTVGQWRDAMRRETWYSAEEAVAAGLADRVVAPSGRVRNAARLDVRALAAARGWRYPGRAGAPAPALRDALPGMDTDPGQIPEMSDEDFERALEDLLMDMYSDIHHLGDLAEAMHADADDAPGGDVSALWRPRAAYIGFDRLTAALAAKGVTNPAGLARHIGVKKYGHAGFAALAEKGRAKAAARTAEHDAHDLFDPASIRAAFEEVFE